MKQIIIIGIIFLVLSSCFFKKDAASALVDHLKQMEKIFEKNQDNAEKLSAELSAYGLTYMTEMQNGVKEITERLKHIEENPMDSFDLIAKVTTISTIIVNIKTNYGHLLDDPAVSESFKKYGALFSAMQSLGNQ